MLRVDRYSGRNVLLLLHKSSLPYKRVGEAACQLPVSLQTCPGTRKGEFKGARLSSLLLSFPFLGTYIVQNPTSSFLNSLCL